MPGKGLTTSEERRDEIFEEMEDVAEASKTGIRPIQSRHATLWAAKAARQTYLPDLQKLERFFHTRCAEPIRCGLDKRSTHVILLKDHAEYEAWWRAMFKKRPADFPDAGGRGASRRDPQAAGIVVGGVRVISAGEADFTRRLVVGDVGCCTLHNWPARRDPARFRRRSARWKRGSSIGWRPPCSVPQPDARRYLPGPADPGPAEDDQDWSLLVRHNAANRGGSLDWSFRMDMSFRASQPRYQDYAEGWSLVGLLNKQPAKFGRLLLELKKRSSKRGSELAAIKKVYGWDDKKLTQEWRKYVMAKGPIGPEPNAAPAETAGQLAADGAKPPAGSVPAHGQGGRRRKRHPARSEGHPRAAPPARFSRASLGQGRRAGTGLRGHGGGRRRASPPGIPPRPDRRRQGSVRRAARAWKMAVHHRAEREEVFKEMKQVALKSGAAIEPIQSQHVTLWAAKEIQKTYLPDLQKLEKFFHTKCAEPIRSGLDKRSTHVVLLKNHAEYVSWFQTMFKLFGKEFDERNGPGGNVHIREQIFQRAAFYGWDVFAISVEDVPPQWVRRNVAASVGSQYVIQLAVPPSRQFSAVLHTGFANGAETVVCGAPSVMFSTIIYGQGIHSPGRGGQDWALLVQQRDGQQPGDAGAPVVANGHQPDVPTALRQGMDACGALEQATGQVWKTAAGVEERQPSSDGDREDLWMGREETRQRVAATRCTRSDSSERG